MSDALVRVKGVSKSFETGDGTIDVLHDIDFEVRAGERLAIVGASGVGKSTLLYILGTLDHPTSGSVEFRGEDLFGLLFLTTLTNQGSDDNIPVLTIPTS